VAVTARLKVRDTVSAAAPQQRKAFPAECPQLFSYHLMAIAEARKPLTTPTLEFTAPRLTRTK
jgi:hypothetical protein